MTKIQLSGSCANQQGFDPGGDSAEGVVRHVIAEAILRGSPVALALYGAIPRGITGYYSPLALRMYNSVMVLDPTLLNLLADWCVNLSAGWFGAAVIVPIVSHEEANHDIRRVVLIENLLFAVAFFAIAYILKRV